MSARLALAVFAAGILIFVAALFVPTFVDNTTADAEDVVELGEGESTNLTDRLSIEAHDINNGQNEVNTTLKNLVTLNTTTAHLNTSETKTVNLSNEDINVTLDSITSNDVATLTAVYSPTFAWDEAPRLFFENMEMVFALLGFLIALASIGAVVNS